MNALIMFFVWRYLFIPAATPGELPREPKRKRTTTFNQELADIGAFFWMMVTDRKLPRYLDKV